MVIKCKNCGKDIIAKTKRKQFCSKKCCDNYRYKPVEKKKKGEYSKCLLCNKEVYNFPRELKIDRHKFCCREHYILFLKQNSFHLNCCVCGKVFYCQPCQIKYRHRKTCSIQCRSKLQTIIAIENRIKKGFTKHQIDRCIRYSKELENWRKLVFERDNYTCKVCNKKGVYLEAHHIKPFAYYPELRFDINNGQTLCKKCHNITKISYKEMRIKYNKI